MIIQKKDIHEMSEEYFFDNISKKKPIILTGIIEQWKIHNFDLEKFGELYGNKTAPVRGSKKDDFKEFMEVEVSEYIRYINNNTEKWYCDFPTDYEEFPNLLYMYSVPKIFKNNTSAYNNSELHEWLYLGSKGTGTPFHVDIKNSHAWNALIFGEKEWLFAEIGQDYLNIKDENKCLKYIQKANELLYIPPNLPHKVVNTQNSLCITGNFWDEELEKSYEME
ncbi:TPA: cupin-like domain-containing protein [Staphylococcus aureus]|nr:cupin-like domain-containing protein [Staphylococcus aureus]HDH1076337.1 cupin-like domain-containing protein [Staphylococcus aureus]